MGLPARRRAEGNDDEEDEGSDDGECTRSIWYYFEIEVAHLTSSPRASHHHQRLHALQDGVGGGEVALVGCCPLLVFDLIFD